MFSGASAALEIAGHAVKTSTTKEVEAQRNDGNAQFSLCCTSTKNAGRREATGIFPLLRCHVEQAETGAAWNLIRFDIDAKAGTTSIVRQQNSHKEITT